LTLAEDDDIAEYLRMCLATNKLFSLMTKDELKLSDLEEIRLLIDGGVNLDETNAEGDTLLICAVKLGYLSIVTHLIEVGADVNAKDKKYGLTALMWAVFKGRLDIVGYLLTLTEAIDVNVGSQNGCTALMMAAWLPESKGQTIVERLLQQKKPKPIDVNQQNENGQTALMIAVQAGNFEVVKKLVEAKADVNARDTNGRTALTLAKNDDIAEYLRMCLAAEQLFSLMTKKEPKLSEVEEIGLLIDGGVNLDKTNKEGDTLLICAVKSGYLSIVTHLIEVGADVNAKDKKYGLTALMWAVFKGRLDIVGYLLTLTEAIDVNAGSKNGCTALMIAAWLPESKGQTIVERLLQQKELNVNQQNENGQTALMIAVQAGNFEVVKKLVEAGAKVDIKDKKGRTAVMYVDNVKEHPEIVKYLKRRSFGDKVAFWENFITEKNAETSKNSRATTHTERRRNH
jgi:ankyrin repeat protein